MPYLAAGAAAAAVLLSAGSASAQSAAPPADITAAAEATEAAVADQAAFDAENLVLKAADVPCDAKAAACVSLSRQVAWLLHDGRIVRGPVPVATGRDSMPTPEGNFHVWYKVVDGFSTIYDSPMPYSVFFYQGDAFHEDPTDIRSHGCVHLTRQDAEYFFHYLHYGDLVEVRE
jgi:lipoprotein-anchoring transpeptidase ErfK/SrfK